MWTTSGTLAAAGLLSTLSIRNSLLILKIMDDLDFILQWTDNVKLEIAALPFEEDDIRVDFLGMLYDATYNYYRGYVGYKISGLIGEGQILFKTEQLPKLDLHIKRFAETSYHPILSKSQTNYLNRNLLLDAWSTFELCTTTFVGAIINDDELERMLLHHYRDMKKILKNSSIDENDNEKLVSNTKKSHLVHVPITRKTDFLFGRANYFRNLKRDKEFLLFLGKWRNTMHTNYIYYGNDYQYTFGNAIFQFQNGKTLKWTDPFEPSPKLYFHIMGNLKNIWLTLIKSITHDEFIAYPDPEQE
jgi:hypothetical protein